MKTFKVLIVVLVAAVLVLAVAISTGSFDVAADTPHSRVVYWLLETVRDRAVGARSSTVQVPPLTDPNMIKEGADHYAEMCTGCHLAPDARDSEIRPGLNPQPPDLTRSPPPAPARAFWVIKHGIKMTAMPAWGTTHSDAAIWNIVAFLQKLPTLSPEQYHALVGESDAGDHGGDDSDQETGHEPAAESHAEHEEPTQKLPR